MACVGVAVGLFTACSSGASSNTRAVGDSLVDLSISVPPANAEIGDPTSAICEGRDLRIGVDFYGSGFSFGRDVLTGMRELDSAIDCVELIILENNSKPETVLANIRSLVSQKVDGIVFLNGLPAVQEEVVSMSLNAGIPIVTGVLRSERAPYVNVDFGAGGTLAGETFAALFKERFPTAEPYLILGDYPNAGPPATDRFPAFIAAVRQTYPGLADDHILTFDTKADPAYSSQTVTALTRRVPSGAPLIVGGWSDDIAYPMMEAAIGAGHPTVGFGFGGDSSGRPFVCNDYNIIGWFPEDSFDYLLPAVVALANGQKLPERIVMPSVVLTPENISEYYPGEEC